MTDTSAGSASLSATQPIQAKSAVSASLPVTGPTTAVAKSLAKIYKIIVVGDSNVGKTCLTYRFVTGRFPQKVDATVGVDFREKTVDLTAPDVSDGPKQLVRLQLWDSAGQERFRRSMVPHYYRNVHAAVFVYDVTNLASFNSLAHWIEEYDRYSTSAGNNALIVPRIIVGNKVDLDDSRRQVPTYIAQQFADSHGMPLFETSALLDSRTDHVDAIFMTLAHKLVRQQPMSTSLSQNNTVRLGAGSNNYAQGSDANDQGSWSCLC